MIEIYDNTRVSDFQTCDRKGFWRHRLHITPDTPSSALAFGSAWHKAMDVVWKQASSQYTNNEIVNAAFQAWLSEWQDRYLFPTLDQMDEDQLKEFAARNDETAYEMLHNYVEKRRPFIKSVELFEVEKPFAVPLDPDNPNLFYAGLMDKIIKWDGYIWVVDHKTTTSYKKDGYFRSDFIDGFSPNSQMDGYMHALHMMYGSQAKGALIDAALVHKTVHEGFGLIPVERAVSQIDAWLWETHQKIKRIQEQDENYKENADPDMSFMPAYPKNTTACTHYGGCPYLYLCKVIGNPASLTHIPDGYKEEKWDPVEELGLKNLFGEDV